MDFYTTLRHTLLRGEDKNPCPVPASWEQVNINGFLREKIFVCWLFLFISSFPGGDDVQQLCEAGEEEFLEIMMLVDMASKPLHVRRLQKALQEWVQNPGKSQRYY